MSTNPTTCADIVKMLYDGKAVAFNRALTPAEIKIASEDHKYVYSMRHDESDFSLPVTVEPFVVVNRYGMLVTDEMIHFPDDKDKMIPLTERAAQTIDYFADHNFQDQELGDRAGDCERCLYVHEKRGQKRTKCSLGKPRRQYDNRISTHNVYASCVSYSRLALRTVAWKFREVEDVPIKFKREPDSLPCRPLRKL